MFDKLKFYLWRVLPLPESLRFLIMWVVNPKFLVAVDALIFNNDGACLLFHHPYRQEFQWGLPGGYIKRGEHPEDAIKREIAEESGLELHVIRLLDVHMADDYPRISLAYLAELKGDFTFTPSVEVSEAKFFMPHHLPPLFPEQIEVIQKHISSLN